MFIKALIAFLALPGIVGGLIPIVLGLSDPWRGTGFDIGYIVLSIGLFVLGWCIWVFYTSGKGTLAPWAPPENLVKVGPYLFSRNPMYLGVLFIVSGFAVLFTSPLLAVYWVLLAVGFHLRVLFNEEKWLTMQFGDEWVRYEKRVPRWLPAIRLFQQRGEKE